MDETSAAFGSEAPDPHSAHALPPQSGRLSGRAGGEGVPANFADLGKKRAQSPLRPSASPGFTCEASEATGLPSIGALRPGQATWLGAMAGTAGVAPPLRALPARIEAKPWHGASVAATGFTHLSRAFR